MNSRPLVLLLVTCLLGLLPGDAGGADSIEADDDLERDSERVEGWIVRLKKERLVPGSLERILEMNQLLIEETLDPHQLAGRYLERALMLHFAGQPMEIIPTVEAGLSALSKDEVEQDALRYEVLAGWSLHEAGAYEQAVVLFERLIARLSHEEKGDDRVQKLLLGTRLLLGQCFDALGYRHLALEQFREARGEAKRWRQQEGLPIIEAFLDLQESHTTGGAAGLSEALRRQGRQIDLPGLERSANLVAHFARMLEAGDEAVQLDRLLETANALKEFDGDQPLLFEAGAFLEALSAWRLVDLDALVKRAERFVGHLEPHQRSAMWSMVSTVFLERGDQPGAAVFARRSLESFELSARGSLSNAVLRALIDTYSHIIYPSAVDVLAAEDFAEGFRYAEVGRAWALRRRLGSPTARDERFLAELADLRSVLSAAEKDFRDTAGSEQRAALLLELNMKRRIFENHRLRHELKHAPSSQLVEVEGVGVSKAQRFLSGSDTALVSFYIGEKGLWRWVVEEDGFSSRVQWMTAEEWRQMACSIQAIRWQGVAASVQERVVERGASIFSGCETQSGAPARVLYRHLIAPIEFAIKDRTRLTIVPHGLLHHVPFAALENPETGRYLAQDYVLNLAPSVSALQQLSERTAVEQGSKVLVLGDPTTFETPLAGARREAVMVAEFFGVEPLLAGDASEAVVQKAAGVGLLHIAAHGDYTPEHPIFSRLVLAAGGGQDGVLEMHEVWDQLDLRGTRLVTLSGCETALGEVTAGDEVMGLTQAFLVAGSRAVVSTLWPVDDEASSALMMRFYGELIREKPAAEALRLAQLAMLADPRYRAPYFWAGYTLTGDGTTTWPMRDPLEDPRRRPVSMR